MLAKLSDFVLLENAILCSFSKANLVLLGVFYIWIKKTELQTLIGEKICAWPVLNRVFNTSQAHLYFLIQKYLFGQKTLTLFGPPKKQKAEIIIVQWFLSTKHPFSYENVRPFGKQLLIRRLVCASRISRDVAQPSLSTNRSEETVI